MISVVKNMDCMDAMKEFPDKYFDLAVVDPPYGIGGGSNTKFSVLWDDYTPDCNYFTELLRVSKDQIIWGGNYMAKNIPFNSTHTIVWDKENGESFMSDGEIAFTSFKKNTTKFFRLFWMSNMMKREEKPIIHPTQKPVALYDWIYKNYLPQGGKVIDTHLGSGSNRIAAYKAGNIDFYGYELDTDYYNAQEKRFAEFTKTENLFVPTVTVATEQMELLDA